MIPHESPSSSPPPDTCHPKSPGISARRLLVFHPASRLFTRHSLARPRLVIRRPAASGHFFTLSAQGEGPLPIGIPFLFTLISTPRAQLLCFSLLAQKRGEGRAAQRKVSATLISLFAPFGPRVFHNSRTFRSLRTPFPKTPRVAGVLLEYSLAWHDARIGIIFAGGHSSRPRREARPL